MANKDRHAALAADKWHVGQLVAYGDVDRDGMRRVILVERVGRVLKTMVVSTSERRFRFDGECIPQRFGSIRRAVRPLTKELLDKARDDGAVGLHIITADESAALPSGGAS